MEVKSKFISYYDSVFEKNMNNELVLYKKDSFYPCIQIEVITIEKSREDMGILEMTVLKLIQHNISNINDIAKLTGFNKADKLKILIEEMIGYGLINVNYNNNNLSLSEIGKQSVKTGFQMMETTASLLLCGITGKLLPKIMYNARKVEGSNLASSIGFKYLIDETPTISLESLSLENINKSKYNLKDEVQYISKYIDYTQVFLEADITIYQNSEKILSSSININKEEVDWTLDSSYFINEIKLDTIDLMEIAENISRYFELIDTKISSKGFNSIQINFTDIDIDALKEQVHLHPLLAYIGSETPAENFIIKSIPLNRLPFRSTANSTTDNKWRQQLQGQVFYLTTSSEKILNLACIYRSVYNVDKEYFKLPLHERIPYGQYLKEKIYSLPFEINDINHVIEYYSSNNIKKIVLENNKNNG